MVSEYDKTHPQTQFFNQINLINFHPNSLYDAGMEPGENAT